MDTPSTLNCLKDGQTARVHALMMAGTMRHRLLDLGFTNGALVKCLQHSASGDPVAYLIRGTVIALRCEDSGQIAITAIH